MMAPCRSAGLRLFTFLTSPFTIIFHVCFPISVWREKVRQYRHDAISFLSTHSSGPAFRALCPSAHKMQA